MNSIVSGTDSPAKYSHYPAVILLLSACLLMLCMADVAYARNPISRMIDVDLNHKKLVDPELSTAERAKIYFDEFHDTALGKATFLALDISQNIITTTIDGAQQEYPKDTDLNQVFSSSPDVYVITSLDYFVLKSRLNTVSIREKIRVILDDGTAVEAQHIDLEDGPKIGLELFPEIIFTGSDQSDLKTIRNELKRPIETDALNLVFATQTISPDIEQEINQLASKLNATALNANLEDLRTMFAANKRELTIIVNTMDDQLPKLEDINSVALENHASLLLLDFKMFRNEDMSDESRLTAASHNATFFSELVASRNYASLLTKIAGTNPPYTLNNPSIKQHKMAIELRRVDSSTTHEIKTDHFGSVYLRGLSPSRLKELRGRWIPWIPNYFVILYGLALIVFWFRYRECKETWAGLWPSTKTKNLNTKPKSTMSPISRILFHLLVPLFIAITLPIVTVISVLLFFVPFVPWSLPIKLISYGFITRKRVAAQT